MSLTTTCSRSLRTRIFCGIRGAPQRRTARQRKRAIDYFKAHFIDAGYGTVYWTVDLFMNVIVGEEAMHAQRQTRVVIR